MSSYTKRDIRKVESAFLLALLLLPAILFALPTVSAYAAPAVVGTPAAVTGATASIDSPVYANIGGGSSDTRAITISNPAGNIGITTITISVPAAAVSAKPSGEIPLTGGVPDCAAPNAACQASVFGSGPYSLQYTDTKTSGAVILPGGASITVLLTITPETATTTTSAADSFSYSVSVTDTGGANTVLNSLTVYETTISAITISTEPVTTQTAGSTFTFAVSVGQTGVPITVHDNTGDSTVSPASFTSGSSAQTITVNDTTAETVAFNVGAQNPASGSTGGTLSTYNATTYSVNVNPAAVTQMTISMSSDGSHFYSPAKTGIWNETSQTLIPAGYIKVSTTDKYGNAAPFSQSASTTVTLSAQTLSGEAAGFTSETSYTTPSNYPWTPSDLSTTATLSIAAGASSQVTSAKYYFGPDYGATSQILATASGLPTATSAKIITYAFQTSAPTIAPSGAASIKSGTTELVNVTLPVAQAGVTVYVWISTNSTDYAGTFSNGARAISATTSVSSSTHNAVAQVAFNVDPTLAATAVLTANYLAQTYTTSGANSSTVSTGTLTTAAGAFAKLTLKAYFNSAESSAQKTTETVPSGTLFVDVFATDAAGNSLTVSGTLQVNLVASAGKLSSNTAFITSGNSGTTASNYQVQYVAPASSAGSSISLNASGTYGGVTASGSLTISIVSANPVVAFTTVPTSVTKGVSQSITGWANATLGEYNINIVTLEYSLNGGNNVTIGAGANTNQFSLNLLLATTNTLTVYAKDSNGVWASSTVQVPAPSTSNTFTFPSAPSNTTIGQYKAINATIVNNYSTQLTAVVFAVVMNSAGQTVAITTATVVVGAGVTASAFPILTGLAHGTYTVNVFVLTTSGVSVSPSTTLTVTV